jgi:hypothetical protein
VSAGLAIPLDQCTATVHSTPSVFAPQAPRNLDGSRLRFTTRQQPVREHVWKDMELLLFHQDDKCAQPPLPEGPCSVARIDHCCLARASVSVSYKTDVPGLPHQDLHTGAIPQAG